MQGTPMCLASSATPTTKGSLHVRGTFARRNLAPSIPAVAPLLPRRLAGPRWNLLSTTRARTRARRVVERGAGECPTVAIATPPRGADPYDRCDRGVHLDTWYPFLDHLDTLEFDIL